MDDLYAGPTDGWSVMNVLHASCVAAATKDPDSFQRFISAHLMGWLGWRMLGPSAQIERLK